MIQLGYRLSPSWNRRAETVDFSRLEESALFYESFPGDIFFKVGDADFSAPWGWVPVLDFARNFFLTVRKENPAFLAYQIELG